MACSGRSFLRAADVSEAGEESPLSSRYLSKLGAGLLGGAARFVAVALVPRSLGPMAYGDFSFLSRFFTEMWSLLSMGTPLCFYTKISQRPDETGLVRFYWTFFVGVAAVSSLLLLGVQWAGLGAWVWPGQESGYVWMGLGWGVLGALSALLNHHIDAYGLTIAGERTRVYRGLLSIVLVVAVFRTADRSLWTYFIYHYLLLVFLCIGWARIVLSDGHVLFSLGRIDRPEAARYVREFYAYSSPLVVYTVAGFLTTVVERWLLQKLHGSAEQGVFALSQDVGLLCSFFSLSLTPLLMREFSKAHGQEDTEAMARLFARYVPVVFALAALIGLFMASQGGNVSVLLGGSAYAQAGLAVSLMCIHPLFRSYSQMLGALYYGTAQTRLHKDLGLWQMAFRLALTVWLLAPTSWYGLSLGAVGLALKTVVAAAAFSNVRLWFSTRYLSLEFWPLLRHQLACIVVFGLSALGATRLASHVIGLPLLSFAAGGALHVSFCSVVVYALPQVFLIERRDIHGAVSRIRAAIRGS